MEFSPSVIFEVKGRQYDGKGLGFLCAKCGEYISGIQGEDWFAIPCLPVGEGGTQSNNCVIVCPKCKEEIGQDGTKIIPKSELPFFAAEVYKDIFFHT